MKARMMILFITTLAAMGNCLADQPVIINNNNNNNPPQNNNCNNQPTQAQNDNNLRPGTYYRSNPTGGTDTIYTTGDKTPYIVDNNNNCNNQPVIQPWINVNPQQPHVRGR